ncbi:MAG: 23S rRNA (uracil(1939)-C(5))-methyltransferase RlmD [Lachnospiraceae bacterium]
MRKDDLITVTIEDLSSEGLGVGHYDGMAFFIKDTVIGDVAEAKIMKLKKTYGYARLTRLITPSPDRIAARCPVARQCGGCQIQAMSYPAQLRFKEAKVRNNLVRIGKFEHPPMEPIIGMEEHPLPNKAQFRLTSKDGRIIAGFMPDMRLSRRTVCLVEENRVILDLVLEHMKEYHIRPYEELTGKGLVRHVMIRKGFATGAVMVCLIVNGDSLPHADALVERLRTIRGMASITLNINREQTNVIMGREIKLLWGQPYIEDTIGSVRFRISPLSFYQVNPLQTEKLYNKALEYAGLTGEETVWDLYCGIGTISLFLAQRAKQVYGVEIVPAAIEDAKANAALNGMTNAKFFVGKAEEVLPEKYEKEGITADVIVVDPPRKGCEESVLATMIQMAPKRIVYVSCDSATLARDLKYLCHHGYELTRCCPTDMFGNSVHVETVCLLSRKDK